jgi:hypothetical protein
MDSEDNCSIIRLGEVLEGFDDVVGVIRVKS